MNRTATVLAATVAALLLSAAPVHGDAVDPEAACDAVLSALVDNPAWESAPDDCGVIGAMWSAGMSVEAIAALLGAATTEETAPEPCAGEPFEIAPGEWDCVIEAVPEPQEPDPLPEPVEPSEEPALVVKDNGGWGWSDAREAYGA